jgi:hypothetical protein
MKDNLDELILSMAGTRWRKVALVIGKTGQRLEEAGFKISHDEVVDRIKALVAASCLESKGNLDGWRSSEVRLPHSI